MRKGFFVKNVRYLINSSEYKTAQYLTAINSNLSARTYNNHLYVYKNQDNKTA